MIFRLTSKKPVLLVGNGVRESGAVTLLHQFIEKTDIPVLTTMNSVDLVQDELKIGFIGVYGNRAANMVLSESDLVISIGARLGLRQIGNKPELFAPKAKLIRVDIDQYELSRDVKPDEEKHLVDAKPFIESLLNEKIPRYSGWQKRCFQVRDLLADCDKEVGNLCIEKISSLLPPNPIVAVDVGQNQCWSAQSFVLKGQEGRLLIGGGYGCMGCGLPYAIGASIATGKGIVYCVTGDGGLQMNIQEFQTVVSEQIPIKIFVINNRVLGKISEIQTVSYERRYAQTTAASGYTVPDFKKVAEAYGIRAATMSSYTELDHYTEWLTDSESCLLNILLPEDTLLIPKVNWNQKEILPKISDQLQQEAICILSEGTET